MDAAKRQAVENEMADVFIYLSCDNRGRCPWRDGIVGPLN
jgi:hypothetical protein